MEEYFHMASILITFIILSTSSVYCNDSNQNSIGSDGSPFNLGQSLFQTPYSASISEMSGSGFSLNNMAGISGNGRNSYPAMFMKGGQISMNTHRQCLKNIVCPKVCHEIDEHGCESCPCGPANGMVPGGYSSGYSGDQQKQGNKEKQNQCIHTLLCMLSCKDGYELGKKDEDGCQSCKCTKQKEKSPEVPKQTGQIGVDKSKTETQTGQGEKDNNSQETGGNNNSGSGTSSGSGNEASNAFGFNPLFPGMSMTSTGENSNSGEGSSCVGPFCAGGTSGGGMSAGGMSGGGGGAMGGMMMSPFGLAAGGAGGPFEVPGKTNSGDNGSPGKGIPGIDCFGPECSAKNGMRPTHIVPTKKANCPSTDLCINSCKHDLKLGVENADGCPSCACIMPTDIPVTEVPHQTLCQSVVQCILNCRSGYELGPNDGNGCPSCSCTAIPSTTPAPARQSPSCEEMVVLCMRSCHNGYHLQGSDQGTCPKCKCLPPPTTTPSPTNNPDIYSVLQYCPATIHCMMNCKTGYQLESDGRKCPICTCNSVPVLTLTCKSSLKCPYGCKVGYRNGVHGCPSCGCIKPIEVGLVHTEIYLQAPLVCRPEFSCASVCNFGYKSGDNSCPTCQCLNPAQGHVVQISSVHKNTSSLSGTTGCSGGHCDNSGVATAISGSLPLGISSGTTGHGSGNYNLAGCDGEKCGNTDTMTPDQTLVVLSKFCPNVGECKVKCRNGFSITGSEAGKCPSCTCTVPTLQQLCPETYQCGLRCSNGFALKNEKGKDCPTCYCISKTIVQGVSNTEITNTIPGPGSIPAVHSNTSTVSHISTVLGHNKPLSHAIITPNNGQSSNHLYSGSNTGSSVVGISGGYLNNGGQIVAETHHAGGIPSSMKPSFPGHIVQGTVHLSGGSTDCMGPACSAKNGFTDGHETFGNHPPPSRCAEILQCVLTCEYGYKLKEKDRSGCPGCQCIQK